VAHFVDDDEPPGGNAALTGIYQATQEHVFRVLVQDASASAPSSAAIAIKRRITPCSTSHASVLGVACLALLKRRHGRQPLHRIVHSEGDRQN
jgi:hypothetical protein